MPVDCSWMNLSGNVSSFNCILCPFILRVAVTLYKEKEEMVEFRWLGSVRNGSNYYFTLRILMALQALLPQYVRLWLYELLLQLHIYTFVMLPVLRAGVGSSLFLLPPFYSASIILYIWTFFPLVQHYILLYIFSAWIYTKSKLPLLPLVLWVS